MRSIFTALLSCALLLPLSGQAEVTRFLIVGDSWAEEQWLDGSHQRVFLDVGLDAVGVSGELTTTSGSTAAEWVMSTNLDRIDQALAAYPHLDTVQLTVGGNDFLDTWNTGFTQAQFDQLVGFITSDVEIVTDYILSHRPEIEILISLYDYPNFEDTRNGLIWIGACSGLWDSLGNPTPLELNTAAVAVIDAVEGLANADPRITHVRHLGQAQNFFGLPGQPPGTLPPPGDITQPSPAQAMRERFPLGGLDCFHFNADAYDLLIGNLVDGYIDDRFEPGLALSFDALSVEYTGAPQSVGVTTTPIDQPLIISYDNQLQPPSDAGTYQVIVTAPGWRESLTGQFEIVPGSQTIDFSAPAQMFTNATPITLEASASSGLPVVIELVSGPATLDANVLTLTGVPGTVELRATQAGRQQLAGG